MTTAFRLGDGAPVTAESARASWSVVAREVLEDASRRGATVTSSQLAKQVQERSGGHTRTPAAEWLMSVVADATADDTTLAGVCRPDPVRAAPVRASRAPRARAEPVSKKREIPIAICPTCFMQLPASGRCDTCG